MSLLIENEIQDILNNYIKNLNINIVLLISNYIYPERNILYIKNINDLIEYFNYPKNIQDIEDIDKNKVFLIEYFLTNITDKYYTINYRIIQFESIIDNYFHRIDYMLFNSNLTNKMLEWMIK